MRALTSTRRGISGFTLVELILVIVIMGIVGTMVAVFMKRPFDAYIDSARRAALTDVADTVVRRMARDIRKALPNSLRQSVSPAAANTQCIEFISTKTGGRYRALTDNLGAGNFLDFSVADGSFDMLGLNSVLTDQAIAAGDFIAVYNLGIPGSDAYAQTNTSPVTAIAAGALPNETTISITGKQFPLASGSNRFHVITAAEQVVSYVCSGVPLQLRRTVSTLTAAAGTSCPATGPAMATNVSACTFVYDNTDLRNALVQLNITFTDSNSGESVSLYHEVHVDNTP
jgi:MSHA biogenesis protein MshO